MHYEPARSRSKSDFLVAAAARGVMLRTSPSEIRGRGAQRVSPRWMRGKKRNSMKIEKRAKGREIKLTL